jgi:hypothetical protein
MSIHIVELIDEVDELIGYGVCVTVPAANERVTYTMRPEVHGTRSQAHSAALDIRDEQARA